MHKKLFIPGPVEVSPEILQAMATPMIGHRMPEYAKLHESVVSGLRKVMFTEGYILLATSSAFGVMEGAIRNLVGKRCANFCNGAFSDKWHTITLSCGKEADPFRVDWGKPITPELVDSALSTGKYDAITLIHNETSTGVMSPLSEIAEVLRKYPHVVSIIDTVSSMSALKIPIDEMGIDCCIFGVQKAFAVPPGLTVFSASEKAMERAGIIEGRGYYFDFLEFEKVAKKNNTPSTPAIPQIYALQAQLERILAEGLEMRWRRHSDLQDIVHDWITWEGFELYPSREFCSRTLTCVRNNRNIDLATLKERMGQRGYAINDGYGRIKGTTFRIPHMGDLQIGELQDFLLAMTEEIKSLQ
ncbi:MAG: alanine--glyoxylate aminotransferase family protein [Candidatus Moranbacteria bacterium]|nr:alanine--glyoxylate aminotransferase family protein [Candidatus Moranbacteria bacterium]